MTKGLHPRRRIIFDDTLIDHLVTRSRITVTFTLAKQNLDSMRPHTHTYTHKSYTHTLT